MPDVSDLIERRERNAARWEIAMLLVMLGSCIAAYYGVI